MSLPCRLIALASLATLVCLAVGCGGGGDGGGSSSADAAQASCRVGKSALPLIPEVPPWWTEGPGPTLALACLHDPVVGKAAIVGYSSLAGTGAHCVNAYDLTGRWSAGEQCAGPGVRWNASCKGAQGCVTQLVHEGGSTSLAGVLTAKVKKIAILVRGKPLKRGVMVAHVHGRTSRLTGAEEPFGYFAAFVNECLLPREVKVELLGPAGSRLGTAPGYTGTAFCPKRSPS